MHAAAAVDEQSGTALPRLLLAPDHELAPTCRRSPVDPAQVVASAVFPGGCVVLARRGDRPGSALAGADPVATEADVRQSDDMWRDDEHVRRAERPRDLAQAERIGDPDSERSDAEPASQLRADGV